jgi:exonuclease SbcC
MKVLKLRLRGFTSYRRHVEIDFSDLELFAITGSNGAGKSSLIDAIIFALYGKVPRPALDMSGLVSQGSKDLDVELEFAVGNRRYKAWRHIDIKNSKANSKARLYVPHDDDWQASCSGIKETNSKIEEAIGLDFDSFVRCIILPQGAFAEFLHDKAGRQEILTRLLGLQILELMQQQAAERHKQVAQEIQQLQTRIAEATNNSSVALLQTLHAESNSLGDAITAAESKLRGCKEGCGELEEMEKILLYARQLEQEQERLLPQREQFGKLRSKIAMAKRLLPLLPLLQQYEKLYEQSRQSLPAEEKLRQETQLLAVQAQHLANTLAQVAEEYRLVPEMEQQLERLQQVRPLQKQLLDLTSNMEQQQQSLSQEKTRLSQAQKQLRQVRESLALLRQSGQWDEKIRALEEAKTSLQKFHDAPAALNFLQQQEATLARVGKTARDTRNTVQRKQQELAKGEAQLAEHEKQMASGRRQIEKFPSKETTEEKLARLEEAAYLIERRQELVKMVAAAEKTETQEQAAITRVSDEREAVRQYLMQEEKRLAAANDKLEQGKEAYQKAMAMHVPYQEAQQQLEATTGKRDQLRKREEQLGQQGDELTTLCAQLKQQEELAKQNWDKAKSDWMAAYAQNLACSLRGHLVVGEACPVCTQKVRKLPPSASDEIGDAPVLEQEARQREKEWKEAARLLNEARSSLSSLETARQEVLAQRESAEQEYRNRHKKYQEIEQALTGCLGSRDYDDELAHLLQQNKKLTRQVEQLRHSIVEQEKPLAGWERELHTLNDRQQERQRNLLQWRQKIAELAIKIGEVDIERERKLAKQQLVTLTRWQADMAQLDKIVAALGAQNQTLAEQLAEINQALDAAEEEEKATLVAWQEAERQSREKFAITAADVSIALASGYQEFMRVCQELEQSKAQKVTQEASIKSEEMEEVRLLAISDEVQNLLQQKQAEIATLQRNMENLYKQIHAVTAGQEVDTLLTQLRRRKKQTEDRYHQITQEHLVATQKCERAQTEWQRRQQENEERRRQLAEHESELREVVAELHLTNAQELLAYKVTPATLAQWEEEWAQGERAWQQLEIRLEECRARLARYAQHRLTLPQVQKELTQKKILCAEAEALLAQKREERGRVLQKIQRMEQDLHDADDLRQKMHTLRTVEAGRSQLSLDLHSDRFPSYVLEYAMQTLAEDGTGQLDLLSSGRYAFGVDKREFVVIDNWYNGEMRSARTLSGGETFLASLALALALAERIYQFANKSGATATLDSLFIDEGFGTLDDEHLDLVVKALQNLQGTGRTVGIISHLASLNNYMPVRLVVQKDKDGSSVQREMA